MSKTATQGSPELGRGPGRSPESVTPPPKLRRQPGLVIAAATAICLGGGVGAWVWAASTDSVEVLAARTTIERGSVIDADDLVRIQVSSDPLLKSVSGDQLNSVVGQRATVDVAAGALLTSTSLTTDSPPVSGSSIVGVALAPGQVPGLDLFNGDRVRVVVTPAQGAEAPASAPMVSEAEIAGHYVSEETGQLIVDLLVPHADAAMVAARAATGNVAIVLDTRER